MLIRTADLELAPGLNALTGETGAGKTIFAQAIGLLLGARGDAAAVGPAGDEAYVEAELDVPDGFFDDEILAPLGELRPEDEAGLVVARRIFGDGRTRAYAWGRAVAREDLAAAVERLIAMSGQFEQRRLARPSYQLDVLDAFCGAEQVDLRRDARAAWRDVGAARRRHEDLSQDAGAAAARLEELQVLVEETVGLESGEEDALRSERARLVFASDLVAAVAAAAEALAPEEGDGAVALTARAERALEPVTRIAPELARAAEELRELVIRLGDTGSELRRSLASFETDPHRLDEVERRLERLAELRRRFRCDTVEELLARRTEAAALLADVGEGGDPLDAAARELAAAESRFDGIADALRRRRVEAADRFATAVTHELAGLGMGDGRFRVDLRVHKSGVTGGDEAVFLVQLNQVFRSRRSRTPPRVESCRASRSRWPRSRPGRLTAITLSGRRRSSSTRSTRASAARPPITSRRRCSGWRRTPRW